MIDQTPQPTNLALVLADLTERLRDDGHADGRQRAAAENVLVRRLLDEVMEPMFTNVLDSFEENVVAVLQILDSGFARTDPSKPFADRLLEMTPSGRQTIGHALMMIGLLILKLGLIEDRNRDAHKQASALYPEVVRKVLGRDTDVPNSLLSPRSLVSTLGGPLADALAEAIVARDANEL
ncbi:MAG: hypothetical protein NXI14_05980 [bacterium]|nr:hypothetical protein [bacterium]